MYNTTAVDDLASRVAIVYSLEVDFLTVKLNDTKRMFNSA